LAQTRFSPPLDPIVDIWVHTYMFDSKG